MVNKAQAFSETQSISETNESHTFMNYMMMTLDGALFMGGIAFLAAQTLMPKMIQSLGGPLWLIAMMPMMMRLGFIWPPLFIAHYVERLAVMKPYVLITGFFQRVPFLIAGLALLYWYETHPLLVVYIVAFAPFVSGFMGGLSLSAWFELLTKVIPENKRASVLAIRFMLSSVIGLFAGGVVYQVLELWPGVVGYGILHIITFLFLMGSFLFFAIIKEKPNNDKVFEPKKKLRENLKELPSLIKSNQNYKNLLVANILIIMSQTVIIPFMGIYAQNKLCLSESFLGKLTSALMIGGIIGNLLAAYLGRKGRNIRTIILGAMVLLFVYLLMFVANSELSFYTVFFALGAGLFILLVGTDTLMMKISPEKKRPTCIALYATSTFPFMLLAIWISTAISSFENKMMIANEIALILLLAGILKLLKIKEE